MEDVRGRIERYFSCCSQGDAAQIAALFCDDAVVYDTNHTPIRTAEAIGRFYVKVREKWGGATWHIDTFVGDEKTGAGEWTMLVQHEGRTKAVRGSEHYEFRDGRISQIRQYWTYDPEKVETGLRDYDYAADTRFVKPNAG